MGEYSIRFKRNPKGETMFDKFFEGVITILIFLAGLYFTFALVYMILTRLAGI
jgi:hypothetical protein